jgi:hypothetical protein
LHQASPRLHQLHITLDTPNHRKSSSGNSHTYPLLLSLTLSFSPKITFYNILPQENPTQPQLHGKWSVFSADPGVALLPELQFHGRLVFMSRGRPYLHVCLLYISLWVEVTDRSGTRADVRVLRQFDNNERIEKICYTSYSSNSNPCYLAICGIRLRFWASLDSTMRHS